MHAHLPSRFIATGFIAAMLLTGCSAQDSENAESQPSTSASSASAAATSSVAASEDASEPANSDASDGADASGSATALPTLADGKEVTLTDEERADFEAGKYVPATAQHPALNVPEPVMPEAAKEQTFEGAKAFLEYWNEATNYAYQTGQISKVSQSMSGAALDADHELFESYRDVYSESAWSVGSKETLELPDNDFNLERDGRYDVLAIISRTKGAIYEAPNKKFEDVRSFNTAKNPQVVTLTWKNGQWTVDNVSGIEGVTYGE